MHRMQFIHDVSMQLNRLVVEYTFANRSKTSQSTTINIPITQWIHLAWTYSDQDQRLSYFYIDGARQQSIDFGAMSLDFESK
jgi:hypothetical protein